MTLKPFEDVVVEHGPTVLRVCRAVLGPHDAEDAWSETFLAAMRAYPQLPAGSNVQAWLVTIAKHKAIDQHRARRRRPMPVDDVRDRGDRGAERRDHTAATDDCLDLWTCLHELPRRQREAIAYHHLAGFPYADISNILGTTETAARRAAADGIKRLRATYRPTTERIETR